MEKTLTIDGKEVRFKANGGATKRYKAQFQRDLLVDFAKMSVGLKGDPQSMTDADVVEFLKQLNTDVFLDVAWTFAKSADPTIPDPQNWLDSFDEFPILMILPELQDLIAKVFGINQKK